MGSNLDTTAKATIGRFILNCHLAVAIPFLFNSDYLPMVAYCFFVAGWVKVSVAFFTRQRFSSTTFNHWSEALWLLFLASGTKLLSVAMV